MRFSLPLLAFITFAACDSASHDASSFDEAPPPGSWAQAAQPALPAVDPQGVAATRAVLGAPEAFQFNAATHSSAAQASVASQEEKIIRTAHARIEVDTLHAALVRVRRIASAEGGFVSHESAQTGDGALRTATIEIRVPAARFDDALDSIRLLGKVETVSAHAQEVTEDFVDLEARIANARRLEERLIALLQSSTGKLPDIMQAERELARVRTEIELYEGRLRRLKDRVSFGTIRIDLHEPKPLVSDNPGENVIRSAFKQAWRNFVRTIAKGIALSGVLLPVLVVCAAPVAWLALRQRRHRRG